MSGISNPISDGNGVAVNQEFDSIILDIINKDAIIKRLAPGVLYIQDDIDGFGAIAPGQWAGWTARTESSSFLLGQGAIDLVTETDNSSTLLQDSTGVALRQFSAATISSDAFSVTNGKIFMGDRNPTLVIKFSMSSTADIRFFAGTNSLSNTDSISSDTPTGLGVGLRYSTDAVETDFMFYVFDGSIRTLISSGVVADTAIHHLVITMISNTTLTITLYDINFAQEATITLTTNLPAGSSIQRVFCGLETRATVIKSVHNYYMWINLKG